MSSWLRAAVALPAALALALPLAAATDLVAGSPAFASPAAACVPPTDASTPAPTTSGGSRESVARQAASKYFPADQVAVATAVAGAESSWNPTAVNKAAGGNYGLWQINSVHAGLLQGRNWRAPETNAWMAFQVWDAADGRMGNQAGSWTPWSAYNSGSYKSYLDPSAAETAAGEAAPAETPAADCAATGQPQVRVATWNVLMKNSKAKIAAGARALTTQSDVFGLQELGDPANRAAAARGAVSFTMSTDRTAVPIFYRTSKYTLLAQGRELAINAGNRIEPTSGDSNTVTAKKWVSWVHLQDKATLQDFYVLNTHLLVGAQGNAKQRKTNKRRVALYDRQLATLTRLADGFKGQGAAVYATCDCNVDYDPGVGPVKTMELHGLTSSWQLLGGKPTHGKRRIDYVWSNATPASSVTGARSGSDHAPLIVTYLSSAVSAIAADPAQTLLSTRTVTDPQSGRTFTVPVPTGKAGKALSFALDQVGDEWKFGEHGPDAWDCSGLTAAAYKTAGIRITPQSDAQKKSLRQVSLADARPGDIFWRKGYVSIYLGTVGADRVVVGSLRAQGAVVIHTAEESDIKAVLRP